MLLLCVSGCGGVVRTEQGVSERRSIDDMIACNPSRCRRLAAVVRLLTVTAVLLAVVATPQSLLLSDATVNLSLGVPFTVNVSDSSLWGGMLLAAPRIQSAQLSLVALRATSNLQFCSYPQLHILGTTTTTETPQLLTLCGSLAESAIDRESETVVNISVVSGTASVTLGPLLVVGGAAVAAASSSSSGNGGGGVISVPLGAPLPLLKFTLVDAWGNVASPPVGGAQFSLVASASRQTFVGAAAAASWSVTLASANVLPVGGSTISFGQPSIPWAAYLASRSSGGGPALLAGEVPTPSPSAPLMVALTIRNAWNNTVPLLDCCWVVAEVDPLAAVAPQALVLALPPANTSTTATTSIDVPTSTADSIVITRTSPSLQVSCSAPATSPTVQLLPLNAAGGIWTTTAAMVLAEPVNVSMTCSQRLLNHPNRGGNNATRVDLPVNVSHLRVENASSTSVVVVAVQGSVYVSVALLMQAATLSTVTLVECSMSSVPFPSVTLRTMAFVECQPASNCLPLSDSLSVSNAWFRSRDSVSNVATLSSWMQVANSGGPLPLVTISFRFRDTSSWPLSSSFPSEWLLVPSVRYRAVPLGMLAAFAFGAAYCSVGHLDWAISVDFLCAREVEVEGLWENALAQLLYRAVDNVTASLSSVTAVDWVLPSVVPCALAVQQTEPDVGMWELTCFDPTEPTALGSFAAAPSSSTAPANNGRSGLVTSFEPTSSPGTSAILVLSFGLLVGVGCGVGNLWYAWFVFSQLQDKVKLTDRRRVPLAMKWRIALAHLLGPFVMLAHSYTIFGLRVQLEAAAGLYAVDNAVALLFYVAVLLRLVLPTARWVTPLYLGSCGMLLFYTSYLLGQALLWSLAALSVNVAVIPYVTSCLLIVLQIPWQVKLTHEELAPSVLSFMEASRQHDDAVRSTAPVNNALSFQLFAVVMMLFMFAVTQVENITPFMAVISSFVMVAYSFLANYSISRTLTDALGAWLGRSDGSGGDEGGSDTASAKSSSFAGGVEQRVLGRTGSSVGGELLARLLESTTGGGRGRDDQLSAELSRLTARFQSTTAAAAVDGGESGGGTTAGADAALAVTVGPPGSGDSTAARKMLDQMMEASNPTTTSLNGAGATRPGNRGHARRGERASEHDGGGSSSSSPRLRFSSSEEELEVQLLPTKR